MTVSLSGAAVAAPSAVAGTILRATSGFYSVLTDDGRLLQAQLRGLLKKERQATDLAVIGDRVRVSLADASHPMIDQVEPRRTKFSRRQPGPRGTWKEDMLVANVDQVLVVFACADPMPHLRMLDRFLVVAEHNEVPAVVVANKVDLVGLDRARELFSDLRAHRLSGPLRVGPRGDRRGGAGRPAGRRDQRGDRAVRRRQVDPAERHPAGPAHRDRGGQRGAAQGSPHHDLRRAPRR